MTISIRIDRLTVYTTVRPSPDADAKTHRMLHEIQEGLRTMNENQTRAANAAEAIATRVTTLQQTIDDVQAGVATAFDDLKAEIARTGDASFQPIADKLEAVLTKVDAAQADLAATPIPERSTEAGNGTAEGSIDGSVTGPIG